MVNLRAKALRTGAFFVCAGLVAIGTYVYVQHRESSKKVVTKESLAQALGDSNAFFKFPSEMELAVPDSDKKLNAIVQYAFDPGLQEAMEALFRSYSPDYGAFVAMDAATGRVLAMVSYSRDPKLTDNLALRATFPSASVFKVVTAAAAIQEQKFSPETPIRFNGSNHTLYRSNVLKSNYNRWSRVSTLKSAFAQSINTVFGKIGAFTVGPEKLQQYAERFGFNRKIASDLPVQQGQALIPADAWGASQAASGFTRDNTMSPMQGALIAAAVANDGVIMEPFVVQSVYLQDGTSVYAAEPQVMNVAIDASTAAEMRELMHETVTRGTSRKSFHGFFRGDKARLDVGGKTGSLTGTSPAGKYDWFVGFASSGTQRIAIASLTIHQKQWRVKSSYLARRAMEKFFEHRHEQSVADNRH